MFAREDSVPAETLARIAAPRIVRFVSALAPRYAAALLRDPLLPWCLPLRALLGAPVPTPDHVREELRHERVLYDDGPAEFWAVTHIDGEPQGYLPRSFPLDARAAVVVDRFPTNSEFTVPHVWVDPTCQVSPEHITHADVCALLASSTDRGAQIHAKLLRTIGWELGRREKGAQVRIARAADRLSHDAAVDLARSIAGDLESAVNVYIEGDDATRPELPPGVTPWREWTGAWFVRAADILSRPGAWSEWGGGRVLGMEQTAVNSVRGDLNSRWPHTAVAHVCDAIARIRAGQSRAALVPLPAGRVSRAPFAMLARAGELATVGGLQLLPSARGRVEGFRMVWDGKKQTEQLALAFMPAPTPAVFGEVLEQLGGEGLRDYVILHRMAAEQGRSGRVVWTWERHRRDTAHAGRVSSGERTNDDARAAVLERLQALSRAELHHESSNTRGRAWRVVGEAPLVRAVAGWEGADGDGLVLQLNQELYANVCAEETRRHFTQLPAAVLGLPAGPLALAVLLAFTWRDAADDGGVVDLPTERLQGMLRSARWRRGGHTTDARATLTRALAQVCDAMGDGCTATPDGDRWRITPPRSWVDAVVHRVPPELPPSTGHAPVTGAQLRAWRERRGLSLTAASDSLGVSRRTLVSAEQRPAEQLPRSFTRARWGGPVEGEQ